MINKEKTILRARFKILRLFSFSYALGAMISVVINEEMSLFSYSCFRKRAYHHIMCNIDSILSSNGDGDFKLV